MTWSFPVASPLALKGVAWLEERIGARYRGWAVRGESTFVVEVLRADQAVEELSAETLEDAVRNACIFVRAERQANQHGRAR